MPYTGRHANFLEHFNIRREMRHVFNFQIWNATDFEFKFLLSYSDFRKILYHISYDFIVLDCFINNITEQSLVERERSIGTSILVKLFSSFEHT